MSPRRWHPPRSPRVPCGEGSGSGRRGSGHGRGSRAAVGMGRDSVSDLPGEKDVVSGAAETTVPSVSLLLHPLPLSSLALSPGVVRDEHPVERQSSVAKAKFRARSHMPR